MNSELTITLDQANHIGDTNQTQRMDKYYRWHAKIYDATRWTFLFGRRQVVDFLPFERVDKLLIAEVGCGTGYNLELLTRRFPKARLFGLDISNTMLKIAKKRAEKLTNKLTFNQLAYGTEGGVLPLTQLKKPNVILFSYCLTMVNPDWERLVLQAKMDLADGGSLAVVDFHSSPFGWFRRWMGFNHVRMEGHILPFLKQHFSVQKVETRRAYGGLWSYFVFIGTAK